MPGWHTIIRGLAPQAGGFRRRPNKPSSVGLSAWLIVVVGRLPCVLQVVAATCSSVSYPNTCQTCNPGSDPVASHAQYITNKPRAVAAIASRFNRVEPSHGQEAFASASTASPQLACRLAAPPGHESGLTPDTNGHEKLGVSTRGSGVRSWRAELFSFPVPHSCSLRSRRIRVPRRRHSCRGHQTQTEGRGGTETTCEGRLGEWVSCVWGGEWRSWQAAFKQRRLRAVSRGQAARLMRRVSWSRVSANLSAHMEQYMWNRSDADMPSFHA